MAYMNLFKVRMSNLLKFVRHGSLLCLRRSANYAIVSLIALRFDFNQRKTSCCVLLLARGRGQKFRSKVQRKRKEKFSRFALLSWYKSDKLLKLFRLVNTHVNDNRVSEISFSNLQDEKSASRYIVHAVFIFSPVDSRENTYPFMRSLREKRRKE